MGNIVKLQNAGESVTWTIAKAETTAGNFGPQVKFESTNGEVLYLPEDSATRQLSRIPLEVAECVGETLVISRDPNPKPGAKPYWGIKLASAVDKAPPSKRLTHAEAVSAPSMGGPIKGLDDFPDEEYGRSVQSPDGVDPYLEPPRAPTPHRVPGTDAPKVAPQATAKAQVVREYLDLLAFVKAEQPKLSDEAVQAAAATIWITWGQKGLR